MKRCICLVTNQAFLDKAIQTIRTIRQAGGYTGDIVVIRGSDWDELTSPEWVASGLPNDPHLRVQAFPDLDYRVLLEGADAAGMPEDTRVRTKTFQYHKFYVFHSYMKQWDRVLYMDAGCTVHRPLDPFWKMDCTGGLVAYNETSDIQHWRLSGQFYREPSAAACMQRLEASYRMDQSYFQSGLMYFDTAIIEPGTFDRLVELMNAYPNALTPDQAILNLYFICERGIWKPIGYGNPYWCSRTMPGRIVTKY